MKKHNINEAWYNTVLDVVGIVDPTGIADLTNAILYFKQGDTFFGILSLISVVPYVGDAVAKPLIGLGKGSKLFKYVDEALEVAKTNPSKAKNLLESAVSNGKNPMVSGLIKKFEDWGETVKKMVDRIPEGKLTMGFKNNLKMWVDLIGSVKTGKVKILKSTKDVAKKITKLSPEERIKALELLKKQISDPNLISSFGKTGNIFTNYKNVFKNYGTRAALLQGVPRLFFGKNPALRSIMRNTKFYTGFLDFIGVANFVGPEELKLQKSSDELQAKMNDYLETDQGQKYFTEEFDGGLETPSKTDSQFTVSKPSAPNTSKEKGDFFDIFFDELFGVKTT